MTPYRNLHGNSNVVSYEITDDAIHVVFISGKYRNYLYNHQSPGKSAVEQMKLLAKQGYGLSSYISKTIKKTMQRGGKLSRGQALNLKAFIFKV